MNFNLRKQATRKRQDCRKLRGPRPWNAWIILERRTDFAQQN